MLTCASWFGINKHIIRLVTDVHVQNYTLILALELRKIHRVLRVSTKREDRAH